MSIPDYLPAVPVFPGLTPTNHQVTSPTDSSHNCIAFAAGDTKRWWWPVVSPDAYWPPGVARQETKQAFIDAFAQIGYCQTQSSDFAAEVEKVCIYTLNGAPTHAARLVGDGQLHSKLGKEYDIVHDFNALDGPLYGSIDFFLERNIVGT